MNRRTFCQISSLAAGSLLVPSSLAAAASHPVNAGVKGEATYHLQVATSPSFAPADLVLDLVNLGSSEFRVDDLPSGTTYYWRVLTASKGETSSWSTTGTFTTGVAVGVAPEEPAFVFDLGPNYPNPLSTRTTIPFTLPQASAVQMHVYTLLGRHVDTLVDGRLAAGPHQVDWDASRVASGTYLCVLEAGGRSSTRKMIVVR